MLGLVTIAAKGTATRVASNRPRVRQQAVAVSTSLGEFGNGILAALLCGLQKKCVLRKGMLYLGQHQVSGIPHWKVQLQVVIDRLLKTSQAHGKVQWVALGFGKDHVQCVCNNSM